MVTVAIQRHFDSSLHAELKERENTERELYQIALKEFVEGL